MNKSKRFMYIFICFQEWTLQFLVLAMLFTLIYFGFNQNVPKGTHLLILAAFSLITYVGRDRISNVPLLILLQIIPPLLFALNGSGMTERVSFIFLAILFGGFSLYKSSEKGKRDGEGIPLAVGVVFVVGMILGNYWNSGQVSNIALALGIIYLMIQILYKNNFNLSGFIASNRKVANMPVRQMYLVNGFLLMVLLLLSGGIMLFFSSSPVNSLMGAIGKLLRIIPESIVRLLFSNKSKRQEFVSQMQDDLDLAKLIGLKSQEDDAITELLKMIASVLGIVILVLVVVSVAVVIFLAIMRYLKSVKGKETDGDDQEFLTPQDQVSFLFRKKKSKEDDTVGSRNRKVRKKYQKLIQKSAKKKGEEIHSYLTPDQLTRQYVGEEEGSRIYTVIYEKARYGQYEITKEELESWK